MKITFEQERTIVATSDKTILELALDHQIPMAHACGGNARCSTCRIVVIKGDCPPRNKREKALADKLGWSSQIRLSCQMKLKESIIAR